MSLYIVMEPPRSGDARRDAERVAFVREGFSWLALFVPALWLLCHRMWLVLIGWIVVAVALHLAVERLGTGADLIAGLAFNVAFAFEANGLRRWTLARRGYREAAVVAGHSREDCERRYFAERQARAAVQEDDAPAPPPASVPIFPAARAVPSEGEPVLGLFPQPERPS